MNIYSPLKQHRPDLHLKCWTKTVSKNRTRNLVTFGEHMNPLQRGLHGAPSSRPCKKRLETEKGLVITWQGPPGHGHSPMQAAFTPVHWSSQKLPRVWPGSQCSLSKVMTVCCENHSLHSKARSSWDRHRVCRGTSHHRPWVPPDTLPRTGCCKRSLNPSHLMRSFELLLTVNSTDWPQDTRTGADLPVPDWRHSMVQQTEK